MFFRCFFLFPLLLLLAACQHYRLGSETALPFATLAVVPVLNTSAAPQAGPPLTNALVRDLASRENLTLASEDQAEAILQVKLVEYKIQSSSSRTDDTGLTFGYRVYLTASATLRGPSGDFFADRTFIAETTIYDVSGNDLVNAQIAHLPALIQDLARQIGDAATSAW